MMERLYTKEISISTTKKSVFGHRTAGGGPDQIDLDNKYSEKLLNAAVTARNAEKAMHGGTSDQPFTIDYDLELLLHDFVKLTEDEKFYKSACKSGFTGILIATDDFHIVRWKLPKAYTELSNDVLLQKMSYEIAQVKKQFLKENEWTKHSIKIYRSPKDFLIGEPISLEEITPKQALDKTIGYTKIEAAVPHKAAKNTAIDSPDR